MCGIYGILNFDRPEQPADSVLAAMGGVITHRGPDDFGQYRGRGVGIPARREDVRLERQRQERCQSC